MGIFEDAKVTLLIGDYLGIDAGGKINGIGIGFGITGLQPSGITNPFHVMAIVELPSKHAGEDFAFSLELRSMDPDTAVTLLGPTGVAQPLRVQQVVRAERPNIPQVYLPSTLPVRVQVGLAMVPGLALSPGKSYVWRAEIDGQHRKGWTAQFHIAGPPPPPVVGGPIGPANIGGITPPIPSDDE